MDSRTIPFNSITRRPMKAKLFRRRPRNRPIGPENIPPRRLMSPLGRHGSASRRAVPLGAHHHLHRQWKNWSNQFKKITKWEILQRRKNNKVLFKNNIWIATRNKFKKTFEKKIKEEKANGVCKTNKTNKNNAHWQKKKTKTKKNQKKNDNALLLIFYLFTNDVNIKREYLFDINKDIVFLSIIWCLLVLLIITIFISIFTCP